MSDTEKVIAEATEKLKEEWFAKGWHACREAMNTAFSAIEAPEAPEGFASALPAPNRSKSASGSKEPKLGTTPHAVLTAVRRSAGLSGGQIVEAVRATGHTAPDGSIKTSIQRLKERDLIVLRHGKWYEA
jgi:hypothetical protein